MSSIEENAFQIARYLLENLREDGQVAIRDALGLSVEDFGFALKSLVDGGYCSTYGQPQGNESGIKRNLARLQEFVNRLNEQRIPLSRNAERLLKLLFTWQTDFPFSLGNHIIAEFGWTEDQYVQVAQELSDEGFVEGEYAGNPFFKISITSLGRKAVRNNFRVPNASQSSLQIFGNNNIVNFSSTLNSVNQFVQANSTVESSTKQELEKLLQELEAALKEVPDKNADDAEAVANMAKSLIESATREKPNKPLVQISAEGLKKAAGNIAAITPNPNEPEPKGTKMKERKSLNRTGEKHPTQVGNEISQGLSQTRKRGRQSFHTWRLSLPDIVARR